MTIIAYLEELLDREVDKYIEKNYRYSEPDREFIKERFAEKIFDKLLKDIEL